MPIEKEEKSVYNMAMITAEDFAENQKSRNFAHLSEKTTTYLKVFEVGEPVVIPWKRKDYHENWHL